MQRLNRLTIATAVVVSLLVPAAFAGSAMAEKSKPMAKQVPIKAVVELFTSQGCSSCPPADRLLKTYADREDVIALTLPVDYWDHLGWKDTLASPRNTKRQYAYSNARGDGSVYTPQVVINGIQHKVGSHKSAIDAAILATSKQLQGRKVPVRIFVENGTLTIEASSAAAGSAAKGATIWLATTQKAATVKIKHGENRSRKIVYYNVVKDLTPVGMWNGKPIKIQLAKHAVMNNGANGCVVFLQQGNAGPIIGAAELKNW